MKNILKAFVVVLLFVAGVSAQAQTATVKIGYVDFAQIVSVMPGQDSINQKLQAHVSSLEAQLKAMQTEYEAKLNDYQAKQATMSQIIKQTKEKEIMDLQQRIEAFNQQAQYEIQNKQMELTQPLIDRIQNAIKAVGKENGFTYILNGNEQIILYSDGGINVLPLVKKKLGIK
ncbi:MAG: OmpH family outer membrane protein [Bacteroidales bacterium]|nr:OmpH family outer membrane protein [Bacteroidales bacterium]